MGLSISIFKWGIWGSKKLNVASLIKTQIFVSHPKLSLHSLKGQWELQANLTAGSYWKLRSHTDPFQNTRLDKWPPERNKWPGWGIVKPGPECRLHHTTTLPLTCLDTSSRPCLLCGPRLVQDPVGCGAAGRREKRTIIRQLPLLYTVLSIFPFSSDFLIKALSKTLHPKAPPRPIS